MRRRGDKEKRRQGDIDGVEWTAFGSKYQRRFALRAGFVLPVVLLAGLGLAQDNTKLGTPKPADVKADADKPLTAGQKYKNIQKLQNLPAAQLMLKMHEYNAALNVQCSFCHVVNAQHNAWDRDDNPMKAVARQMISVVSDLNAHQPSLNGQATCYMCHHGHPEPVTSIPATDEKKSNP